MQTIRAQDVCSIVSQTSHTAVRTCPKEGNRHGCVLAPEGPNKMLNTSTSSRAIVARLKKDSQLAPSTTVALLTNFESRVRSSGPNVSQKRNTGAKLLYPDKGGEISVKKIEVSSGYDV